MTNGQIPSDEDTEVNALGARSDLVNDVAHEMRNPLNALLAYTELLKTERHGRHSHPKYKQYSEIAHDAAEALMRICDRLLLGDETGSDNARVETDACAVAERMIARYSAMAEQKKITLDMRFDREFPKVPVPVALLEDVLGNLVVNAIKFTPPGKRVGVDLIRDPGSVRIEVWDEGRGIPKTHLRKIFEPFEQVAPEDASLQSGAGLGLAIVQSIVALHEGELSVESAVGEGARFSVRIPEGDLEAIREFAVAEYGDSAITGLEGGGLHVLYVDDIEANRLLLQRGLSMANYEVELANCGRAAIDKIRGRRYDLVLLDIKLPDIDGFDVLRYLRRRWQDVPTIAVTASLTEDIRERIREAGFDGCHGKPIDIRSLLAAMSELRDRK